MPYILPDDRPKYDTLLKLMPQFKTVGELNYFISNLCQQYIEENGESYTNYNALVGVLECIKLELYRRKISIYEDKKLSQNGDVY